MRHKTFFALTSLLLTLFNYTPSFAQTDVPQQRQRAIKVLQDKEQRRRDEETIRNMADPGADIAFVVAITANIRDEPSRTGPMVKQVKRGEILSLIEREAIGTWYHVIHTDTAIEGWIDQSVVITKLSVNRYNAPRFQEEESEVYENPKVRITNRELHTDLNLKLNGKLYVITANTTQTITVPPGHYEYYGWSPGVRAAIGKNDFAKGYVYSWSFYIRRR